MKFVTRTLAALLLVAAGALANEPYTPTQSQLDAMLRGNTMHGIWAGRPYVQFFAASGVTRYREPGSAETSGQWRIDKRGRYCSVWPPSDRWACYRVLVSGSSIYWKSGDEYYPAEVNPGNSFDPE